MSKTREPDDNEWDTFRLVCLQMGLTTTIDQVVPCSNLICPDCAVYVHYADKANHDARLALFLSSFDSFELSLSFLFDSLYRIQSQRQTDEIMVYVFSPAGFYVRYM